MFNQSWSYIRQSVTGPAHLKADLPNQDYTLGCIFHQGMAIAVADGLGSKSLSHLGSKAACESVKSAAQFVIKNNIHNEKVIPRIIHAFWCAKLADYELTQCGTTLNYAIIYEDDCFLGKLGDGMILVDKYEAPALLFDRDDEDGFSNLTNSLTHRFDLTEWQTQKISTEHVKMIFMCTDGISDDLLANQKLTFAQELLSTCQNTTKGAQTRFTKKILQEWPVVGHSDDKSFIFAFKREL